MDIAKLYEILAETTVQLRKGPEIEHKTVGNLSVTDVYMMPSVDQAKPDLVSVDMHFLVIGVDNAKAEARRDDFVEILNEWPNDELDGGPSYMTVGGTIGDQGAAFQMFALGQVLGLWQVITPETVGMTGEKADQLAGSGFIMMSGYRKPVVA